MDDLTMTRLCAEAMGYRADSDGGYSRLREGVGMDEPLWFEFIYDPLHDDAQAMALVKRFKLDIIPYRYDEKEIPFKWIASAPGDLHGQHDENLNRAIVECCARMQASK